MKLKKLVQDKEKVNELLQKLDMIAREYDHYEYGLPMHTEQLALMREAVIEWVAQADDT